MAGGKPRICATIVNDDLRAVQGVEPLVDLFEVRLDLIGGSWPEMVRHLRKPWLACNRRVPEGGRWQGSESERIRELLKAVVLGANIIDVELSTPDVAAVVGEVKGRADCLLSYHDLKETPSAERMQEIVRRQLAAGADICKLVTTARSFEDNVATLRLIADFPEAKVVAFAMGDMGYTSRVLCPLVGGHFVYASIGEGRESAPGQLTVRELREIYGMLADGR